MRTREVANWDSMLPDAWQTICFYWIDLFSIGHKLKIVNFSQLWQLFVTFVAQFSRHSILWIQELLVVIKLKSFNLGFILFFRHIRSFRDLLAEAQHVCNSPIPSRSRCGDVPGGQQIAVANSPQSQVSPLITSDGREDGKWFFLLHIYYIFQNRSILTMLLATYAFWLNDR